MTTSRRHRPRPSPPTSASAVEQAPRRTLRQLEALIEMSSHSHSRSSSQGHQGAQTARRAPPSLSLPVLRVSSSNPSDAVWRSSPNKSRGGGPKLLRAMNLQLEGLKTLRNDAVLERLELVDAVLEDYVANVQTYRAPLLTIKNEYARCLRFLMRREKEATRGLARVAANEKKMALAAMEREQWEKQREIHREREQRQTQREKRLREKEKQRIDMLLQTDQETIEELRRSKQTLAQALNRYEALTKQQEETIFQLERRLAEDTLERR